MNADLIDRLLDHLDAPSAPKGRPQRRALALDILTRDRSTAALADLKLVAADLRAGLSALRLAEKMDGYLLIAETITKLERAIGERP